MTNKNNDPTANKLPSDVLTEDTEEKPVIDINTPQPKSLEKIEESAGNYEGMKRYWNENKKLIVGTAAALGIFAYIGLGPMGGYSILKQKWTKPLENRLNVVKSENNNLLKDKKEMKKKLGKYNEVGKILKNKFDFNVDKQNPSDLERIVDDKISKNPELGIEIDKYKHEYYSANTLFNTKLNTDKMFFLATYAINLKKPVDLAENPYNMTYCGSRYIWDKDIKHIAKEKWAPFEEAYKKGKVDIVMDFEEYGPKILIGNWKDGENFEISHEIELNKSQAKEFTDLYKALKNNQLNHSE